MASLSASACTSASFSIRLYKTQDREACRALFVSGMRSLVPPLRAQVLRRWPLMYGLEGIVLMACWAEFNEWNTKEWRMLHPWGIIASFVTSLIVFLVWYNEHIIHEYIDHSLNDDFKLIDDFWCTGKNVLWVAEHASSGKVIGMVGLDHKNQYAAELRRMSVANGYRRMGIAQQLLKVLESHAVDKGYHCLVLGTSSMQLPAQALYERVGWVRARAVKFGWKSPAYELCYTKMLPAALNLPKKVLAETDRFLIRSCGALDQPECFRIIMDAHRNQWCATIYSFISFYNIFVSFLLLMVARYSQPYIAYFIKFELFQPLVRNWSYIFYASFAIHELWLFYSTYNFVDLFVKQWRGQNEDITELNFVNFYNQPGNAFVVAEDKITGRIVATAGLQRLTTVAAEVRRFFVKDMVECKDLGDAMIVYIEQFALSQGYTKLILKTSNFRVAANELYQRHTYYLSGSEFFPFPRNLTGLRTIQYCKYLSHQGKAP